MEIAPLRELVALQGKMKDLELKHLQTLIRDDVEVVKLGNFLESIVAQNPPDLRPILHDKFGFEDKLLAAWDKSCTTLQSGPISTGLFTNVFPLIAPCSPCTAASSPALGTSPEAPLTAVVVGSRLPSPSPGSPSPSSSALNPMEVVAQ